MIHGSGNVADYGTIEDFGFGRTYGMDYTGEGTRVGLIVAKDAEYVGIVGRGTINGNSDVFFDPTKPHYSLDFDPNYTRQASIDSTSPVLAR